MAAKSASYESVKLPLTKKEYAILEYLVLHKNQTIDVKEIIEHAWDSEADFFPDTLKYHIHAIKKKLVEIGCKRISFAMFEALDILWEMSNDENEIFCVFALL